MAMGKRRRHAKQASMWVANPAAREAVYRSLSDAATGHRRSGERRLLIAPRPMTRSLFVAIGVREEAFTTGC
jgi:hypothetical protein